MHVAGKGRQQVVSVTLHSVYITNTDAGSSWIRGSSRQEDPVLKAARTRNQILVSRLLLSHSISNKTANLMRRRYGANAQRLRVVDIETLRVMGESHKGEMPDHLLTEDEVLAEDARLKLAGGVEGAAVATPGWHRGLVLGEGKKEGEEEVEEAYSSNWELEDEDEEMGEAEEIEETEVEEDMEKGKGKGKGPVMTEAGIWSPYYNEPKGRKWAE